MINFNLQRTELLVIMAIVVSGISMYYTSTIVEPVKDIVEDNNAGGKERLEQLKKLTLLAETAVDQNANLEFLVSQEMNLTKPQQEKLVTALNDTIVLIPTLKDDIANIKDSLIQNRVVLAENITKTLDQLVTAPPVATENRQKANFDGIQKLLEIHNATK